MVVTIDLVDEDELDNIHPKRKAPIANRMARWVLANAYDRKEVAYSGPVYDSMSVDGSKLTLNFSHADEGLVAKNETLDWFEIAGEDGLFLPAEATIEGATVVLTAAAVTEPTQARYCWSKIASGDLFNAVGLPAAPFRTQPAEYVVSHQGNPLPPEGWDGSFYQRRGHLLDPSGIAVKGYGVHLRVSDFDSESGPVAYDLIPTVRGVSGSNILRIEWNTYAKGDVATSAQRLDEVLTRCIEQKMISLVSFNDLEGSEDPQVLQGLVSSWMQSEYLNVFRKHEQKMLLEVSGGWNGSVPEALA